VYDYPPRASHELLMNAVIHRNYESTTPVMINHYTDRVEILSPGGLYGDLTPEQFPGVTAYRNPIVAEAAKVLGFVNRFGRGIAIAQSELARNGSLPAEFDVRLNHVLAMLRRRA
jgi:ATP-dependent DNA helicase RecG